MHRILALLLLCGAPMFGARIFQVTVDTSAFNGTAGFVEMQFNPGPGATDPATVTITGATGPAFGVADPPVGGASGSLPAGVTIVNSDVWNDHFQAATFASTFNFLLTFSGVAVDNPTPGVTSGSTFGLTLYDSSMAMLLPGGTFFPNAPLAINVGPDGVIELGEQPAGGITFNEIGADIPEPGAALLTAAGLTALALLRRRRLA